MSGWQAGLVDKMIRHSVRRRFRNVYWNVPAKIGPPAIFYANHFGWMDGYMMYLATQALGCRTLAWVESYDAFPLFRLIGALPFPVGDASRRAATVRQTIELLRLGTHTVSLFPEGRLRRPGPLLEFQPGIGLVAGKVPAARLVPVGIRYEMSMHERPEAWLTFGAPHTFDSLVDCRERVADLLTRQSDDMAYVVLHAGTPSIDERMGLNRLRK